MKKVLIITYYWPPSGGSGVQRWMYFTKYLAELGFEPIVLTVSEKYASYKNIDEQLLTFVDGIRTVRTKSFEPLKIYSLLRTGNTKDGIPHGVIEKKEKGPFHRISNYLRSNVFIPDARVGWNKFAIAKGRNILQNEQVDIIVSTGPPQSSHLIALALKKEFGTKWLADFRDPWTEIYYNSDLQKSERALKKDAALEREVLDKSDIVLTVGMKLRDMLSLKLDSEKRSKFKYIYNGFDSDKMAVPSKSLHKHFEITFIGLLTANQPYKALVEALQQFTKSTDSRDVVLCLAGNIHSEVLDYLQVHLPGLRINHMGYISHDASLELMKRAQLLVNVLPETENAEIIISGKQMEYVATGNPILCIARRNGECALILEEIKNAGVYEKDEIAEMTSFIREIYQMWQKGVPLVNNTDGAYVQSKSRRATGRQLSLLLDGM